MAVMAPGDVRVDVKKLEKLIQVKKLSFMPGHEMKTRLGLKPGGVDPLSSQRWPTWWLLRGACWGRASSSAPPALGSAASG